MNIVQAFGFESFEIRFVDGKPVANDVAIALGYVSPAKTISTKVSAKNKGVTDLVTPGGNQSITVLEEAGIYQLIFGSKLQSAEKFQDWLFSEVLPSIRKTGSYSIAPDRPQRQLAPQRDLIDYYDMAKGLGIDKDPILVSLFSQRMAEQLGGNTLASTQQVIVAVRANELGYSAKDIGTGSALGAFVKKQGCKPTGTTKHGKYNVNVYDSSEDLDLAIGLYFS